MIPDEAVEAAVVHFEYMIGGDSVVAICTASNRFDSRFRSSSRFEDVTCQSCIAEWAKVAPDA